MNGSKTIEEQQSNSKGEEVSILSSSSSSVGSDSPSSDDVVGPPSSSSQKKKNDNDVKTEVRDEAAVVPDKSSSLSFPLPTVVVPERFKNSVILGRGRDQLENPGNKKLRALALLHLEEYSKAQKEKTLKSRVVSKIVSLLQEDCEDDIPAFVKRNKSTGEFEPVSNTASREKVGYTFRDILADRYKSSSKSKVAKLRALKKERESKGNETVEGSSSNDTTSQEDMNKTPSKDTTKPCAVESSSIVVDENSESDVSAKEEKTSSSSSESTAKKTTPVSKKKTSAKKKTPTTRKRKSKKGSSLKRSNSDATVVSVEKSSVRKDNNENDPLDWRCDDPTMRLDSVFDMMLPPDDTTSVATPTPSSSPCDVESSPHLVTPHSKKNVQDLTLLEEGVIGEFDMADATIPPLSAPSSAIEELDQFPDPDDFFEKPLFGDDENDDNFVSFDQVFKQVFGNDNASSSDKKKHTTMKPIKTKIQTIPVPTLPMKKRSRMICRFFKR